jgi:catechol 2,3-dioxygenase-like lactoylglutathione lyase family enzyme
VTDLAALLRAAGDALAVPTGPPPSLAGRLPDRRPPVDLDHLHLGVRDLDASADFYARWFGLHGEVVDGTLFARNAAGFLLCLTPADEPSRLVGAHVGFTFPDAPAVRAAHREMAAAGVSVGELTDDPAFVSFRAVDPDGNVIEVYWE